MPPEMDPKELRAPSHHGGHSKESLELGSGPAADTGLMGTLNLAPDLAFRTVRNTCLLFLSQLVYGSLSEQSARTKTH